MTRATRAMRTMRATRVTKNWEYLLGAVFAFFTIGVLASTVARAQDDARVVSVAGKAEILEAGRRFQARVGYTLSPGQSIALIGGGEVVLTSADGDIKIKVISGSTLRYDGRVQADERPWGQKNPKPQKTSTSEKTIPQFSIPFGKLELEIKPGRETRVVAPLILAAVRGTKFSVTVDRDGGSRIDTQEGLVAAYGRNGESRLTSPGRSASVTARDYGDFLAANGVTLPKADDWRSAPAESQESVDSKALGPIFDSGGGDLLVAVLSNPNASPTAGVNALAVESLSVEPGSLFVGESQGGSGLGDEPKIQPASQTLTPDSTLLDEGLPAVVPPQNIQPVDPRKGNVFGEFAVPMANRVNKNFLIFDLDFGSGLITDAEFKIYYLMERPDLTLYDVFLEGERGTGQLDLNTLNFSVNNFSNAYFYEDYGPGSSADGYLGPGTAINGNFLSPINFGDTANGQLTLQYIPSPYSNPITNLPNNLNFSGTIGDKHFYEISGTFVVPPLAVNVTNNFTLIFNQNNGNIFNASAEIRYTILPSQQFELWLGYGTGTLTAGSFAINFNDGYAYINVVDQNLVNATFTGSMATPDLELGTQVSSSNLALTYSATTSFPASFNGNTGEVTKVSH